MRNGRPPTKPPTKFLVIALATIVAPSAVIVAQSSIPPHLPVSQLNDIATILAHDEGWPLGNPDYTLDIMRPVDDDGFDSIGIYRKRHLVRMYSIYRATGDVVDFMRGCQVFRFDDIKRFQAEAKQKSHAAPLTDEQLAAKAGCPKLTVINSRWVHEAHAGLE